VICFAGERLDLHQRELLLDTVIQTTPLVMVLTQTRQAGSCIATIAGAPQLFHGRPQSSRDSTSWRSSRQAPRAPGARH